MVLCNQKRVFTFEKHWLLKWTLSFVYCIPFFQLGSQQKKRPWISITFDSCLKLSNCIFCATYVFLLFYFSLFLDLISLDLFRSNYLSFELSLSVSQSLTLSLSPSLSFSLSLSLSLSVSLFLFISLSVPLSLCLSLSLSLFFPSLYLSISLFFFSVIFISISLSLFVDLFATYNLRV